MQKLALAFSTKARLPLQRMAMRWNQTMRRRPLVASCRKRLHSIPCRPHYPIQIKIVSIQTNLTANVLVLRPQPLVAFRKSHGGIDSKKRMIPIFNGVSCTTILLQLLFLMRPIIILPRLEGNIMFRILITINLRSSINTRNGRSRNNTWIS